MHDSRHRLDPDELAARFAAVPGLEGTAFDPTTSPADDLYQFANGNWGRHNAEFCNNWQRTHVRVQARLFRIFEETAGQVHRGEAVPASIGFFVGQFCLRGMDREQRNAEGARPLVPYLDRIARIDTRKDLARVLAYLHNRGFDPLWKIDASMTRHGIIRRMELGAGAVSALVPGEVYPGNRRSKGQQQRLLRCITKIFSLTEGCQHRALADAKRALGVDDALRAAFGNVAQPIDGTPDYKFSVTELPKLIPNFDWMTYFQELGLSAEQLRFIYLSERNADYFAQVAELTTSIRLADWSAYLRGFFSSRTAGWLGDRFIQSQNELLGVSDRVEESYDSGAVFTDAHYVGLRMMLGHLYAQETVTEEMRRLVTTVDVDVQTTFDEMIQSADWLTHKARKAAIAKQRGIRVEIGAPSQVQFPDIRIEGRPYVSIILDWLSRSVTERLQGVGKPIDPAEWDIFPQSVFPRYDPLRNQVLIPAGYLSMVFENRSYLHPVVLYGRLGTTLGHERHHAFDRENRETGLRSRLRQEKWGRRGDRRRIAKREETIVDLYDGFGVAEAEMAHENAADMGGLQIADKARELMLQREFPRATPADRIFFDQIFHVAAVMDYAGDSEDTGLGHSPFRFRAVIPSSNLLSFSSAFDVAAGDGMYIPLKNQIRLWDKVWKQWWIPGSIGRGQENIRAFAARLAGRIRQRECTLPHIGRRKIS
jgi:putative endopeptidase